MPANIRAHSHLVSTLVALLAWGAAVPAHAGQDFAIPVVTCTAGDKETLAYEQSHTVRYAAQGMVHQSGPNPPPGTRLMFYCPVPAPMEQLSPSTLRRIKLMYEDHNAAGSQLITAELHAKSLGAQPGDPPVGTTGIVGQVASSPSAGQVAVASAPLGAIDFSRFAYYITIHLYAPTPPASPGAILRIHAVMLTSK